MKKFDIDILNKLIIDSNFCCEKHPQADLFIYGYNNNSSIISQNNKWDDISIHCRGLIVNSNGDIVERPFPKFWTFQQYLSKDVVLLNENQLFKIPTCNFRILEKIDGTMVTLYWVNDKPCLATQRSFTNIKAKIATEILHEKYSHTFKKFNRNYTYIFESVYPETKVIIDYGDKRDLFLIGIVNKETGELQPIENIGFPTCKDYTSKFSKNYSFDDLKMLDLPNKEGFVIHYDNGQLIKIKFPWYQKTHRLLDKFLNFDKISLKYRLELANMLKQSTLIDDFTTFDIWESLRNGDFELYKIKYQAHGIHYMMGFELWLEFHKNEIIKSYKKQCNSANPAEGNNYNYIWDSIKPQFEVFNLQKRLESPHIYETIMWKWENRYLK